MPDHPVIRTNAPLGDVPRAVEHLERLHMLEPVALQREHELLHLDRRRQVRRRGRRPASSTSARGPSVPHGSGRSRTPGRSISPRARRSRGCRHRAARAVGDLPEERLDVREPRLTGGRRGGRTTRRALGARRRRHSASVSAPEPVPASSTREPGNTSAYDQDRPEVLRVDHLRAPRHLQHEVGQPRPERPERHRPSPSRTRVPSGYPISRSCDKRAAVGVQVPPVCRVSRYGRSR